MDKAKLLDQFMTWVDKENIYFVHHIGDLEIKKFLQQHGKETKKTKNRPSGSDRR